MAESPPPPYPLLDRNAPKTAKDDKKRKRRDKNRDMTNQNSSRTPPITNVSSFGLYNSMFSFHLNVNISGGTSTTQWTMASTTAASPRAKKPNHRSSKGQKKKDKQCHQAEQDTSRTLRAADTSTDVLRTPEALVTVEGATRAPCTAAQTDHAGLAHTELLDLPQRIEAMKTDIAALNRQIAQLSRDRERHSVFHSHQHDLIKKTNLHDAGVKAEPTGVDGTASDMEWE